MSQRAERLSSSDVADEVRDFYERYPYPPPVEHLANYQRHWQERQRRRADFHLFWPARPYQEDFSILIAGCGTSQAAKHALRWPAAHVTAIDCSHTSVHCTEALKEKYNLQNLEVYQLDLERVGELGMTFDQIICTGVLHHLADPDTGLNALRDVLKRDGGMHLMVYAPYGRAGIYMLQEFARRISIRAADAEIRDLLTALRALPSGHPLQNLLSQAPDFRNQSALADALLHPQDRAYSVPELFKFIEKAGLSFGRWLRQAPYSIHTGVVAAIPQAARMALLSPFEQYAAIELFRGTMVRHSVIAYHSDSEACTQQSGVSGDAWLDLIPIRMSDTILVQDHLPRGAVGVLINQTHTYRDLFLPLSPTEKLWFDQIDDARSIRDIVQARPSSYSKPNVAAARGFFERLWWNDQVVFDSSNDPKQSRQPLGKC